MGEKESVTEIKKSPIQDFAISLSYIGAHQSLVRLLNQSPDARSSASSIQPAMFSLPIISVKPAFSMMDMGC